MATELAESLGYWFRKHYNLPPHDPRFLSMTSWEIAIEYEAYLASEGEPLKKCPRCGFETHRQHCVRCTLDNGEPLQLTGDAALDDAVARIEAGEDVDLDEILRAGFEPVPRGE